MVSEDEPKRKLHDAFCQTYYALQVGNRTLNEQLVQKEDTIRCLAMKNSGRESTQRRASAKKRHNVSKTNYNHVPASRT